MLKTTLYFLASFVFFCTPSTLKAEPLSLNVNAEAAILMNAETGAILYEKNCHQLHYPASTTKIITAICALMQAEDKLDVMIAADQDCIGTVTEEALRRSNYTMPAYLLIPDGSHIGIKKGELLSFRDLLYGMMLASGDDASNVIAKYVGGTIPQFVEQMNAYVRDLGCTKTTFYNPHGLHHPKQVTTAYELATITREAIKHPLFCEIVSTIRYPRPKTNKQASTTLLQGNRLLRPGPYYYSKAFGVKTGYYSLAGNNIVAAAKDGERTLIAVVLKNQERKDIFLDSINLFNAAFNQLKVQRVLLKKGPQKFELEIPQANQILRVYTDEDLIVAYYPAEEPKVKCQLFWDQKLTLPIEKGEPVGELVLLDDHQQVLNKLPIYAQDQIIASTFSSVTNFFSNSLTMKILGAVVVFLFLGVFALQLRKN